MSQENSCILGAGVGASRDPLAEVLSDPTGWSADQFAVENSRKKCCRAYRVAFFFGGVSTAAGVAVIGLTLAGMLAKFPPAMVAGLIAGPLLLALCLFCLGRTMYDQQKARSYIKL